MVKYHVNGCFFVLYIKKMFCTSCITFSLNFENSNLITELKVTNTKSIYGIIKKHEISKTHCDAVFSLHQANFKNNIDSCINPTVHSVDLSQHNF